MDLRWFQDFLTLAEVRNFTRAAQIRNLSQAAFSRRIQGLEQWLGAQLIDRNAFPTSLTDAGERFRETAAEVIGKVSDARAAIGNAPARDHVRIACPYALATTRLSGWWKDWSASQQLSCSLELGNVHDTVSALMAGAVDVLICFQLAAQPIQIDAQRYDRIELDTELVRPYAARHEIESGRMRIPGTLERPLPLLMYSPSVYFARVVDAALENASEKVYGFRLFEAEMSDVLGDLASSGLGIAWLPDSSFHSNRGWDLVPVGDGKWDVEVAIYAYKSTANQRLGVGQLWQEICGDEGTSQ
jgi:DNA-binding transcriptional LysR family regulator